jgi:hypothetical protein
MFSAGIGQVRAFAYHEKKLFVAFLEWSMLALFSKLEDFILQSTR